MAKGLGLKLVGFDPYAPDSVFEELGAVRCDSVDALLAQSDVLSLHCPLTPETREMLNAESIARMPKGAYVVNTARGGLINEPALVAAIRSGQLAGAGRARSVVGPRLRWPALVLGRPRKLVRGIGRK